MQFLKRSARGTTRTGKSHRTLRFSKFEPLEQRRLLSTTMHYTGADPGTADGIPDLKATGTTQSVVALLSGDYRGVTKVAYNRHTYIDSTLRPSGAAPVVQIEITNLDGSNKRSLWPDVARLPSTLAEGVNGAPDVLTQIGAGFTIQWIVTTADDRVTWDVTLKNTSTTFKIVGYNFLMPTIKFRTAVPIYAEPTGPNGVNGVLAERVDDGQTSVYVVNETPGVLRINELMRYDVPDPPQYRRLRVGTTAWGGSSIGLDTHPSVVLTPGQSDHFITSLRFSPKSVPTNAAIPDGASIIQSNNPFRLVWNDRRIIENTYIGGGSGQNVMSNVPTTQAGYPAYQAAALAYANNLKNALLADNAQGLVVWDPEGPDQYINDYTFAGDPRLIPITNPAFNSIADQWFKVFTDAGLRVGMTIRTGQLVQRANGVGYDFVEPASQIQNYIDKINYAKNRWGATLFYVDCANDASYADLDAVQRAIPGILLLPELVFGANVGYQAFSAPLRDGTVYHETPLVVRQTYVGSFSTIYTNSINPTQWAAELTQAVQNGDILMGLATQSTAIASIARNAGVNLIRTPGAGGDSGGGTGGGDPGSGGSVGGAPRAGPPPGANPSFSQTPILGIGEDEELAKTSSATTTLLDSVMKQLDLAS